MIHSGFGCLVTQTKKSGILEFNLLDERMGKITNKCYSNLRFARSDFGCLVTQTKKSGVLEFNLLDERMGKITNKCYSNLRFARAATPPRFQQNSVKKTLRRNRGD